MSDYFTEHREGETVVLRLGAKTLLRFDGPARLEVKVAELMQDGVRSIVLDLAEPRYMDPAGGGAMSRVYLSARQSNARLELRNVDGTILRALEVIKILSLSEGSPSQEATGAVTTFIFDFRDDPGMPK